MKTIIYKEINGCQLKGDFYPTEVDQAPLIVYLHGGGLIWGSRKDIMEEQVTLYNKAGYHVLSVDYRLAPETKLPQIAEDIRDVFRWLANEGKQTINFDPKKVAVIGSSAGGYLSLLSGTFEIKPKAIISFYGYGSILGEWYTRPSSHFTKMPPVSEALAKKLIQNKAISVGPIEQRYAIYLYCRQQGKWNQYVSGLDPVFNKDELMSFSPVNTIDSDYPPTMLLHGDQDEDVPYEESVNMQKALEEANIPHQFITIPNGQHVFDKNMQNPAVKDAFDQVIKFLNVHV